LRTVPSLEDLLLKKEMQKKQPYSHLAAWLLPLSALMVVLWLEADVPGLPPLVQGQPLWRALGNSSKGLGFSGLFSVHALFDVSYRLGAVLAAFVAAWILARYAPCRLVRIFQKSSIWVQNLPRRRFGMILFLLAFAVSLAYFGLVRGFTPRLGDEIACLFQARLFSQGQVSMPAPPMGDFFKIRLIVSGARWFSQFPLGHSLFLAPAVMIGIPWIIGPLMGGVAAVAIWLLGARLYNEQTGRLAGALALISPYIWYMSGSYLSHSTCLAMGCLAGLGLVTSIQENGIRSRLAALGAGAALGAAALIRPLTAVGLALGLVFLFVIWASAALGWRRLIFQKAAVMALFVAGAAPVAALVPLYNLSTTGHPMQWGYELAQRSSHELGFGKRGDLNIDFTPGRALFNTRVRLRWLDGGFYSGSDPIPGGGFFFWPFPAIALSLAILVRGKPARADVALAGVLFSLAAVYFFYYYLEICWGSRFLYETAFALLLLTARGAIALGEMADHYGWAGSVSRTACGGVFVASLLIPAVLIAGAHIALPTGTTQELLYDPVTWPTRRVDAALTRALQRAEVSEGLVFLENAGAFYETAWRRMFVDQDRRITFAKDLGDANKNLIAAHGNHGWIATYNADPWNPEFRIRPVAPD
jgi:hypothetical protein